MTVLLERQVAAQTHSPAVRQQFMASGCLWESWELPLRETGAREGTKGRQQSPSSAGTPGQGLPACTAPCSAPSPRGRAAEAKSRGQEEFSPSGRVYAGSRTLPPWRAVPVLLLRNSPPTSGRAGQLEYRGWWPRGGLAPGVGWPLVSTGWPPDRVCQSELGLGSSQPAYRCWGKTWCSLRISGLHLGPLVDGAG